MVKENTLKPVVIAIDGYSSCGKSTFAKKLAKLLNFTYVDSGAMYRAVTRYAMQQNIDVASEKGRENLINKLPGIEITFDETEGNSRGHTLLNGKDVEKEIRSVAVTARVSEISKIHEVREKLVNLQRKIAGERNIVMDGRDIGTTVFPDAAIKIFMTASPEIRAQRRYDEYIEKGQQVSYHEILENIKQRDYLDENRDVSPLQKASDALLLDNSHMTPAAQLEWIKPVIQEKTGLRF